MKATIIISMVLIALSGCASVNSNDQSIANLSQKVDELSNEISKLKVIQAKYNQDIQKAKAMTEQLAEDSQKTNQRIDNFIESYKK